MIEQRIHPNALGTNKGGRTAASTRLESDRMDTTPGMPDYDASDELEYGIDWFAWILRGIHPPPSYLQN